MNDQITQCLFLIYVRAEGGKGCCKFLVNSTKPDLFRARNTH